MLFSQMEPPAELEREFNEWYENEHIPARLALPGFAAAVRYRACEGGRKYLAVYEINDLAVLESPGYQVLKTQPSKRTALMLKSVSGFTRYTCSLAFDTGSTGAGCRYLYAAAFHVPQERQPAFDRQYEGEHVPALMRVPGALRVRHYKVFSADGGPWTDIAMHDLATAEAMDRGRCGDAQAGARHEPLSALDGPEQSASWLYEAISVHS